MKVGDKVKINPETIPDYFDECDNPLDEVGVIVRISDIDEDFDIDVEFSGGEVNSYHEDYLIKQG